MRLTASLLPLMLVATCAAKKKDQGPPPPPPVGFSAVGSGQCWFPPDWEALTAGERRSLRSDAIAAVVSQWKGEQGGNAALDAGAVDNGEYALLAYPAKVELITAENLDHCKRALASGDVSAWSAWVGGLRAKLTAGECEKPLDAQVYWYLDVSTTWQGSTPVCAHKEVLITVSSQDQYRLVPKGAWINAEGDPNGNVATSGAPCTTEQCKVGQLIVRFTGLSGVSMIVPVGLGRTFDPPEHGRIEFMVNEADVSDNTYRIENGMQHHTSVTFAPAGAMISNP